MQQKETYDTYIQFCIKHGCNPISWNINTNKEFQERFKNYGPQLKEWRKKLNNLISKRYRIKQKIKQWKNIYFTTFTIAPKYLKTISRETFIRYVKEIFKGTNYIANEDYGKTRTKRLHFHITHEEKVDTSKWFYGRRQTLKCNTETDDIERLSKYQTKLANHILKEKGTTIIHGRKRKEKTKNT